jgi:hypothetical protein
MDVSVGNTGFSRYKYDGTIYTSTAMHAIDGLGSKGFDEIRITSITFKVGVTGGGANGGAISPQAVILNGNINPSVKIRDITILDHLDLDLVAAEATHINWEGSGALDTRIRNLEKLQQNKSEYKNVIIQADNAYNAGNYAEAKRLYQNASALLPNESYPRTQLSRIEKAIQDKQAAEERKKQEETARKEQATQNAGSDPARRFENRDNNSANNQSDLSSTPANKTDTKNTTGNSVAGNNTGGLSEKIRVNGEYVQVFEQNGSHYIKRADGSTHQTTKQAYDQISQASAKKVEERERQGQQVQMEKEKEAQAQQNFQNQMSELTRKQQEYQREQEAISQRASSVTQAFAAGQRADNSLNAARKASLSQSYNSIEELENDFRQQMAIVNQETSNYSQISAAAASAYIDATGNYGTSYDASINQGLKLISGIASDARAAKAKKEAQERLRAEREAQLAEIENKRKAAIFGLRQKMFTVFAEGKLPLESNNVKQNEVFVFAYIAQKENLSIQESGAIAISNVITVKKMDDGSFPYKSTIVNNLKKFGSGNVTIVGYYLDGGQAEEMHNKFSELAAKSGLQIKPFSYNPVKEESEGGTDFWETGAKADERPKPKITNTKKADFWND